jgi:hypothetical protein
LMSRENAILLLKEIMTEHDWIRKVPIVHLTKNPHNESWEVKIKVDVDKQTINRLENLAKKYKVAPVMDKEKGYLILKEASA